MATRHCPACQHAIELTAETVGRIARCRNCQRRLSIGSDPAQSAGDDAITLALAPCAGCGAETTAADRFCTECGASLTAPAAEVVAAHRQTEARQTRRRTSSQRLKHSELHRKVKRASTVILWLGILFCFFGLVQGALSRKEAEDLKSQLDLQYEADDLLELEDGSFAPLREIKANIDTEVMLLFGANIGLGVIFFALFFWSKRAPVPASIMALCIYLVVQAGSALFEPSSLIRGILFKVFFVIALCAGIKAALKQQADERQDERRALRAAQRG